ncbi:MAG TPA: PorV/PorQ family protein [bacterium]|nr:PorV/PorQ family protein [bacterium]
MIGRAPWLVAVVTLVALGAALSPAPARAADPGDTGLAFLKIGVGARAAGMAEAYVAVAQDPTSTYWNPAGIANTVGNQVHASHNEWISDVRYEYLAAVHGMKGHAVGAHVALLHMGELDGRDESGNFVGSFRAYDISAGLTYGRRVMRSVELGATGKFLFEKIDQENATGFAGDVGVRYRTPLHGLTAAGTLTNMGSEMKFVDDPFVLPFAARLGVAYRSRALLDGFVLASDLRMPNDSDAKFHFGAEFWPHEMIALRGGLKSGYDEETGAFGFGIKYGEYVLDYAFVPFSSDSELGDTHRVSMDWRPALD